MIPPLKLSKYLEMGIIEIAPLAFMRGRTLDHAFVILDEAQNTTEMQMKMFLTRLGPSAKFVITGDLTQIDLPPKQRSGLKQAIRVLEGVEDIPFIYLKAEDVVRHKLVKKIIKAYETHLEQTKEANPSS
jgi:phosphate starvation-inducible PhoH-like protein